MRPEVKEHLMYLRDALSGLPEAALTTPAFLVGPQDDGRDRIAWLDVVANLKALLSRLPHIGDVEQLDAEVEALATQLQARVKAATPWQWWVWERGVERGGMVVTTQTARPIRTGMLVLWVLTVDDAAVKEQARHALYTLIGVLLGAQPKVALED